MVMEEHRTMQTMINIFENCKKLFMLDEDLRTGEHE